MQTELQQKCEDALERIDIAQLLSRYGHFEMVKGDLVGPCPYHKSYLAGTSLIVRLQSKTFHCAYGKCDARGSIIQLIAEFEKSNIEMACNTIIQFVAQKQSFVQDTFSFVEQLVDQKRLPVYTQTQLRILCQCPLRYWNEYTRGVRLDQQLIQSTIGSLIHLALRDYFNLPKESRKQSDLFSLFDNRWGKGYGPRDEQENWLGRAHTALENALNLNLQIEPVKVETEKTRSTTFPFETPIYRLISKTDRVDWYGDSEYCLVDYKWDERPFSEKEAALDFQTVFYYITWISYKRGIPPKLISYQFLTPGIQVDVIPTVTTMEAGIDRLMRFLEKAQHIKEQAAEPEATRNDYCYNCKLFGKCMATATQS